MHQALLPVPMVDSPIRGVSKHPSEHLFKWQTKPCLIPPSQVNVPRVIDTEAAKKLSNEKKSSLRNSNHP